MDASPYLSIFRLNGSCHIWCSHFVPVESQLNFADKNLDQNMNRKANLQFANSRTSSSRTQAIRAMKFDMWSCLFSNRWSVKVFSSGLLWLQGGLLDNVALKGNMFVSSTRDLLVLGAQHFTRQYFFVLLSSTVLRAGPIVESLDNAIYWIKRYPRTSVNKITTLSTV